MQDHEYCGNYGYGRNADRDKGFAEAMFAAGRCIRHCPANGTGALADARIPFVSVPTVSKREMSHALA
jgi:hypothetical protein